MRQPHLPATGYIRWKSLPHNGFRTTGEAGCWVYAFWLACYDTPPPDCGLTLVSDDPNSTATRAKLTDRFIRCHGVEQIIALPQPDAPTSPNCAVVYPPELHMQYVGPTGNTEAREAYLQYVDDAGAPVLAAVCLGSDAHAWIDERGNHWWAAREDLTWRGRRLLSTLDRLYGRRAELVTYLDT